MTTTPPTGTGQRKAADRRREEIIRIERAGLRDALAAANEEIDNALNWLDELTRDSAYDVRCADGSAVTTEMRSLLAEATRAVRAAAALDFYPNDSV